MIRVPQISGKLNSQDFLALGLLITFAKATVIDVARMGQLSNLIWTFQELVHYFPAKFS
jgi:hypothetical protein